MKYISFLIIFFYTASAVAQQLTLPDAINIALKKSLDIQLAKNTVTANNILNNYGVAGGLPLVSAAASDNESITNVNQKLNSGDIIKRSGAASNSASANVTGSILLYNGNRVVATKNRLEQLERQSEQWLNAQVQNTIAGVTTAYYDIVRQQGYIKTIEQSIIVARQRLDIVKAQQNVGLANNADLFQSQLDLNALEQSKQSQQLIIDQAKTELLRLLYLKPDSIIAIQDTIIADEKILLSDVLDNLQQNPDLLAAQDQIRINELIVKETAAQRYPSVRANAGYNFNRTQSAAGNLLLNQSNGPFAGISIGIPIYNGSIFKRQQKVAELDVQNATLQKDILAQDYSSSVVKAYQAYANSLNQLETQKKNLELSQQLLSLVLQRFQLRQATIVEVRQAQQSFEAAGYTMVNLSYAAKAAEVELKRLSNRLSL